MDTAILYYKVLPWFWKVKKIPCFNQYPYASILADHFFLQRSGELVTKVGLNAENEIIHTLAFLAGAMVWSQVLITHLPRP